MKAAFTRHAWQRVLGRLSLTPLEVAQVLDWDLCVDVGVETGKHRVHRLFYSAPDDICFVAVQDQRNGAVITILPLDYHETLAWPVSDMAQMQAQTFITGAAPSMTRSTAAGSSGTTSQFRVGAYFRTATGELKAANLGSWPGSPYEHRIESLLEDDLFFATIRSRLADRGLTAAGVESVYVRVGRDGAAVRISLNRDEQV